jgi:mono/diheme cytochrome c family protein
MMKLILHIALITTAGCIAGCAAIDPSPEAIIGKPEPPSSTDPKSGREIFDNLCTTCHNTDGSPVDPSIKESDIRNYSKAFESFDSTLNNGPGAMPIFTQSQIDSAARHRLFDHIKTFH